MLRVIICILSITSIVVAESDESSEPLTISVLESVLVDEVKLPENRSEFSKIVYRNPAQRGKLLKVGIQIDATNLTEKKTIRDSFFSVSVNGDWTLPILCLEKLPEMESKQIKGIHVKPGSPMVNLVLYFPVSSLTEECVLFFQQQRIEVKLSDDEASK